MNGKLFFSMTQKIDPMHITDAIELIIKATQSHLHYLDEEGLCKESDDYVVALYVFENWIELVRREEEKEAMREGEWNSDFACGSDDYPTYEESVRMTLAERDAEDKFDHIEEKNRDYSLGEQESQIRNEEAHQAKKS